MTITKKILKTIYYLLQINKKHTIKSIKIKHEIKSTFIICTYSVPTNHRTSLTVGNGGPRKLGPMSGMASVSRASRAKVPKSGQTSITMMC